LKNVFKLFGIIAIMAIIGVSFAALSLTGCGGGDDGTLLYIPPPYIPPEDKPVAERWWKWIDDTSTATLVYSVDDNEVCTITVGGIAETNNATGGWFRWKAQAQYDYTAQAGKRYMYKFEAWTQSGARGLTFQYCTDNEEENYLSETVSLTTTPQTFTVSGKPLSRGVLNHVEFQCADQLGTFYVKMISITESSVGSWEGFSYNEADGTITISGYDGAGGSVTIPAQINGKPVIGIEDYAFQNTSLTSISIPDSVTSIGAWAFSGCNSLTSVTIGNGVTSIGDGAFTGCSSLTSVTIPGSVTSIGAWAFQICSNLTSVTIPGSVTSIGGGVFSGCNGLTTINVNSANSAYTVQDNVLYNKNKTTLVAYPGGKWGAFTIPNSVTSIVEYAFENCSNLTSVTIPDSVTSIGDGAFTGCSSLTSVTIPDSVTSIGDGAFGNCSGLTTINVGAANSAYAVQDSVLYNKNKTILIQYPRGKTGNTFTIPNSVTSIGGYAFRMCSLTSVTIPNSVTSIGSYAFLGCNSLTSVTIPNSVTSIGFQAFDFCSSLTSVTLQGTITVGNFSDRAFQGDLRDKYLARGIGTYTRASGGYTWTKQP